MQSKLTTHAFHVSSNAQRMYLADRHENGHSVILRMTQTEPGFWELNATLAPGTHRLRYYAGGPHSVTYFGPASTTGAMTSGWDAILPVPRANDESHGSPPTRPDHLFTPVRAQSA